MKLLSLVLALGGFFLVPTASFAATYYISPSGNDANNGTSTATAWQTIAKVNGSTFAAGDSILFEGGQTFTGSLEFTEDSWVADANNPVVIRSYGTGRATISSGSLGGIDTENIAGFEVHDLILVGAGDTDVSGIELYNSQTGNGKLDYVYITNLDISGYGHSGIAIWGGYGPNWEGEDTAGFTNITIEENVIHNNASANESATGSGILVQGYYGFNNDPENPTHTNLHITGNVIYDNHGTPSVVNWSGSGIVVGNTDGALIEYNTVYNNGKDSFHNNGPVGIFAYDANDITIQFNESYGNKTGRFTDGGGFDLDGGTTNSLVQYNYSHDNDGAGFMAYGYADGYVSTWSNNTFRYNISYNDGLKNTHTYAPLLLSAGGPMTDIKVYNNIFIDPRGAGAVARIIGTNMSGYVANNIFYTGTRPLVSSVNNPTNLLLRGNSYFATSTEAYIWNNVSYSSYDAWQTASNQEKINGVNVGTTTDPLFMNPGSLGIAGGYNPEALRGYSLNVGSPLINAGLDLFDLFGIDMGEQDFFGNAIPNGDSYDIGFYEYDSILPTVSITAPQDGATVSGASVTLSATANDNIGIAGVQFFVDGGAIGSEITTGPFTITWDSTSVENSTSTISAVARDTQGNTASSSIAVLVSNTEPSNPPSGSGSSSGSGRRPVATPSSEAQAIEALIAQYRTILLQAHAAGIVLPQNILALLGISGAGNMVRDLQVGSEGADVRNLQTLLIGLGYSIAPGATGYFGEFTRAALAQYQKENAIVPSAGYFGALTRAYMKTKGLSGIWW